VAQTGYRQVLTVSEGAKDDKASWTAFLRKMKEHGLKGLQLFVSGKYLWLVDNLAEFIPKPSGSAAWFISTATWGRLCRPAR
jgi:transposase-like protein